MDQGHLNVKGAFLPFVNDLPQYLTDSEVCMFADDFVTTIIGKNDNEKQTKVQTTISQVLAWFPKNKDLQRVTSIRYVSQPCFRNRDYLIVIDEYSKWLEILPLRSKSCSEIIGLRIYL